MKTEDKQKISDQAVNEKTGKKWVEWFKVLDKMKAQTLGHTETARKLRQDHKLNPWWSQAVTVRYEKEKGYWVRSGKDR